MRKRALNWIMCLALTCAGLAHAGTKPDAQPKLSNDDCLACHSDDSLKKEVNGKQVSLQVHGDKFKGSIHGSMFTCVDCHKDVKSLPHDGNLAKPTCSTCHADEQKAFETGVHGKALAAGNTRAADCESCHGNIHEILPASDPNSRVAKANVPKMCGSCHNQPMPGMPGKPAVAYQESVHGKLVAGGNQNAAVCSDCHNAHDIKRAGDFTSPTFRANVPQTCAKCHTKEQAQFAKSIHGKAVAEGNTHAPVCIDCHGVHSILQPGDKASSVNARNIAEKACAQCHNNVRMTQEFGIPGGRADSYNASYHGMANALGSTRTANCASCHGAHNILPSSDPESMTNSANLVKTCGQCHPGANDKFAMGKIHLDNNAPLKADVGATINYWVKTGYILLIIAVIGFMVAHNLLIFVRKIRDRKHGIGVHAAGPRVVVRMTVNQRIQHALLFITFFTLVLTGFALKYPDAANRYLFVNELVRGWVHRIAGALMIVVSLYHCVYLAFTGEGRKMFMDMLPELKDATDIIDSLAYYLGCSTKKPQFKRFNYAEKMEYWALVWGTFVMGLTGVMAWFKVIFGSMIPRWWIDVAITVHFYEAILATLAIIVWHFYQVILDPDTYPVNFAFVDGKMSLEHYQEEHPLDSDTLKQYGDVEKYHTVGKH